MASDAPDLSSPGKNGRVSALGKPDSRGEIESISRNPKLIYELEHRRMFRYCCNLTYEAYLFVNSVRVHIPTESKPDKPEARLADLPGYPHELGAQEVQRRAAEVYQFLRMGPYRNGCVTGMEPAPLGFAWIKNIFELLLERWGWGEIRKIYTVKSRRSTEGKLIYRYNYDKIMESLYCDVRRRTIDSETLTALNEAYDLLREGCYFAWEKTGGWPEDEGEDWAASFDELFQDWFKTQPATELPSIDEASAALDAPTPSRTDSKAELPDLVTLDQAAAAVHRSKRTLEHYKTRGNLPPPIVRGGRGSPGMWDWKTIRPWLETRFTVRLPETYPANRKH